MDAGIIEGKVSGDYIFSRQRIKTYAIVLLVYALISLVMLWPITTNIAGTTFKGGDPYQSLWNLWWSGYATFTLHTSLYHTNFLYFPVGANLFTEDLMPLAGIFSIPLQAVSLTFAYNILTILGFILSGLFMFMLALHFVKSNYAAFIAGMIYAFSPMHIAQSYFHLNWASIEWIPLFILFFLLILREKKQIYVLGASISFILVSFMGDLQQGLLTAFFIFVFLVIMFFIERKEVLNIKFLTLLGEMVVLILIIGSPLFVPVIRSLISSGASVQATTAYLPAQWSNDLLSFILPSYYNFFFTGIASSYYNQVFAPDINEKVAYIGYSVLFLVLVALYADYKKEKLAKTKLWALITIIFLWFSIGPFLLIAGNQTPIPGIYYLYHLIPVLNIVREPGRFDLFATIGLAILAAFGIESILNKYSTDGKKGKEMMLYITIAFAFFIFIEYNGMPTAQLASATFTNTTIPKGFYELGAINSNYTVMLLPDLPNATSPAFYLGQAMYYQTAFKKPIIGGYTSRENLTQSYSASLIPLSVESSYLEEGQGLVYVSPIQENYTNATLLWLDEDNVAFVGILRQAYTLSEQEQLLTYLTSVFGQPVYQDNTTSIFSTTSAINNDAGKTISAYDSGAWYPGYAFCSSSSPSCTETFESMWWGQNTREIVVYSPSVATDTMNLQAMSDLPSGNVYLFLNGASQPIAELNLTNTPSNYTVHMQLYQGLNQILLYESNSTIPAQDPYLSFGIRDITFR